jgi:CDP-diacylglycerol--serine O-phosphatidyltransferase
VLVGLLALAAVFGGIGDGLWLGRLDVVGGRTLAPLSLLFALSGSLMISRIRIPKP